MLTSSRRVLVDPNSRRPSAATNASQSTVVPFVMYATLFGVGSIRYISIRKDIQRLERGA